MQIKQIAIILPSIVFALAVAVTWAGVTVMRLRADSARRQYERESALQSYLAVTRIEGKRAREATAAKLGSIVPAGAKPGLVAL